MYKVLLAMVLFCNLHQNSYAQNKERGEVPPAAIPAASCASVEAMASYITQNYTTDTARVRAIYVWVASNISYDLPRLQAREKNKNTPPQTVAHVLATRSAVCQGYTDLFVALCKGVGINALAISGYTKSGGAVSPVPHAWAAAALEGEWYLFDPTWGAGYVKDNQFVKWFNNAFYKVPPAKLIVDHMPFDPLYQFLSNPLTHKEFIEGKPAAGKTTFHYNDSLKLHKLLSGDEQMAAELRRLDAAGIQNDLLLERQQYLKTVLQSVASKDSFDEGVQAFTAALDLYKEYIGHKNKQFSTLTDADLRQMVDNMEQQVKRARALLVAAEASNEAQRQAKTGNIANVERFWTQLTREQQFVTHYFAADAAGRRQLFTRR